MATGTTKLSNLVNPQVMADMVSEALPALIKFTPFATVDRTLAGTPGNTITLPVYDFIGDAEDVAEGTETTMTTLTATTSQFTVKKAMKGVSVTDEALLSAQGDPMAEVTKQLTQAIAGKIDTDCYNALASSSNKVDNSSKTLSYSAIVDAVDALNSESDVAPSKVLFVNPKQVSSLRKDADFISMDKYGGNVMMSGEIGMIAGARIVPSKRITASTGETSGVYNDVLVMTSTDQDFLSIPALTIYLKRDVMVETDRNIKSGVTDITANEHYIAALTNASKAVVLASK